jgi:anti-sigma factor RsiW
MTDDRPDITCRELIDFLYLYLENELPGDRRAEFERHLGVCDACREYIREYEDSIRMGKDALAHPDVPADETTPEELVRAILASRSGS